jgi:hypothetical protein
VRLIPLTVAIAGDGVNPDPPLNLVALAASNAAEAASALTLQIGVGCICRRLGPPNTTVWAPGSSPMRRPAALTENKLYAVQAEAVRNMGPVHQDNDS